MRIHAEDDTVRGLTIAKDGSLQDAWTLRPEQPFGKELHLSTSGNLLLISDTKRHRLLLFSFGENLQQPPALQCQFGESDRAGDDLRHLDSPTLVSIDSARAILYASGIQRIVKLRVRQF